MTCAGNRPCGKRPVVNSIAGSVLDGGVTGGVVNARSVESPLVLTDPNSKKPSSRKWYVVFGVRPVNCWLMACSDKVPAGVGIW